MMLSGASRWVAATGALALGAAFLGWRAPARANAVADPSRFLADAREGTARYDSLQQAIDDGFTRVGAEFPAMGEHWVSFARVMEDTLDARRPSVLIYVNTVDGPRLAGVAYSRLIGPDAKPPVFPFPGAWHEHNGAVSEESLPSGHAPHTHQGAIVAPNPADSPRFFILHAWLPTANPDGPFATDNWTLPLVRLGLDPRTPLSHDAIRALALGVDTQDYHRGVLAAALSLGGGDDSVVAGRVRARRAEIDSVIRTVRGSRAVSSRQAALLGATWDSLWLDLSRVLPARAAELTRLRARM
jgi:hypothetical protein